MRGFVFLVLFFSFLSGQEIGKPFVQMGHEEGVSVVAVTTDNKYVITGSSDNTIKIWNRKLRKEIRTIRCHKKDITSLVVFDKNKKIISASHDKNIIISDIKTGEKLKVLKGHKYRIQNLVLSKDEKYLISYDWDSESGEKGIIILWNLKDKKIIKRIKHFNNLGNLHLGKFIDISPDSKYFFSAEKNGEIVIRDLKTGNKINTIIITPSKILLNFLKVSNDGKYLVTSVGNIIVVWDANKKKIIYKVEHLKTISAVCITFDSKYIISSSYDGSTVVWDIATGRKINLFLAYRANTIVADKQGKYIFVGKYFDDSLKMVNMKTFKVEGVFSGNVEKEISKISNGGSYFISSSKNGNLKQWSLIDGNINKTFKNREKFIPKNRRQQRIRYPTSISSINISKNDKYIFTGNRVGVLKSWDIDNAKRIKKYNINVDSTIEHIVLLPNKKDILLTSWEKFFLVDKEKGTVKKTFINSKYGDINALVIHPNKQYYVVGDGDGVISIWDIKTHKKIKSFKGHFAAIGSLTISKDGEYILSGGLDAKVKLWNFKTKKLLKTFKGHFGYIYSLAFSNDGKYIFSGGTDKILMQWNLKNFKLKKEYKNIFGNIDSMDILPNKKMILINSSDGRNILWDIEKEKILITFVSFKDDEWIAITPDGYFNASKNGAKHLNVLTAPLKVTSVDAYYEKFYRPDIVKLALQGKTVDTGLKMSDIKPAPSVEIVGLPNKTTKKQIEVTLKLKDMGGGIGDIRMYRNGTAISLESRTIQRSQKGVVTKKYTIPLEKGKNKIEAIALEKTNSAKSEPPATATIMANYSNHSKPSLHAVVIGIEEFRNQKLNLQYTKADATALKTTLERYSKSLFDSVNVTLLTSKEETTKENISKVLTKMQSLNPNDMFLLFIASHGVVDDGNYYLITSNVGSTRTKKLKQNALSQDEITKLISNIPTGKKLIILDTCSAGALGDSIRLALLTRGMSEDTAIKILSRATGTTILSASLSTQQALEGYKGHGLFSYVLLEGLKKEADLNGDGFIKTPELVDYVDERVLEISKKAFGVEQFPTVNFDGQSFPVTRVE